MERERLDMRERLRFALFRFEYVFRLEAESLDRRLQGGARWCGRKYQRRLHDPIQFRRRTQRRGGGQCEFASFRCRNVLGLEAADITNDESPMMGTNDVFH